MPLNLQGWLPYLHYPKLQYYTCWAASILVMLRCIFLWTFMKILITTYCTWYALTALFKRLYVLVTGPCDLDCKKTPGPRSNTAFPIKRPRRLFKNRQFWPDAYTQDDKTRISKLKQTGNQACKQILIHGFLKHSQKSVLRLIVSLIVSGATFQARKVALSKYFSFLSSLWVVALSFW